MTEGSAGGRSEDVKLHAAPGQVEGKVKRMGRLSRFPGGGIGGNEEESQRFFTHKVRHWNRECVGLSGTPSTSPRSRRSARGRGEAFGLNASVADDIVALIGILTEFRGHKVEIQDVFPDQLTQLPFAEIGVAEANIVRPALHGLVVLKGMDERSGGIRTWR